MPDSLPILWTVTNLDGRQTQIAHEQFLEIISKRQVSPIAFVSHPIKTSGIMISVDKFLEMSRKENEPQSESIVSNQDILAIRKHTGWILAILVFYFIVAPLIGGLIVALIAIGSSMRH